MKIDLNCTFSPYLLRVYTFPCARANNKTNRILIMQAEVTCSSPCIRTVQGGDKFCRKMINIAIQLLDNSALLRRRRGIKPFELANKLMLLEEYRQLGLLTHKHPNSGCALGDAYRKTPYQFRTETNNLLVSTDWVLLHLSADVTYY